MTTESEQIKRLVSERYAKDAKAVIELTPVEATSVNADACCAPSGQERAMTLYEDAQLAGLPTESIAISLGCGNPTALAGLQEGERVLDLGSGGGIDCFLAAQQVGETGHVIGLDMTPDMLELARSNQAKLGLTNVEFVHGEIENIPLPDASVDVVISNCVVCLSPDKDAVFREAFRVLSPGGRLHVSDMMALNADGPARKDTEAWVTCSAGAEPKDTYLGRLRGAGFEDIAITDESAHIENDAPADVSGVKVVAHKPEWGGASDERRSMPFSVISLAVAAGVGLVKKQAAQAFLMLAITLGTKALTTVLKEAGERARDSVAKAADQFEEKARQNAELAATELDAKRRGRLDIIAAFERGLYTS